MLLVLNLWYFLLHSSSISRRVKRAPAIMPAEQGAVCDTDVSFFMRLDKEERIPAVYY